MYPLACKTQNYAWGRIGAQSLVGQLVSAASSASEIISPDKPYAELWMGTHPSAPSMVVRGGGEGKDAAAAVTLSSVLEKHNVQSGSSLPYLFKVLSIDKALSIQAHPDKKLAEQLHAKDPKNYPDANHKPELVVALTPFEALCCFRPLAQIAALLRYVPEFASAAPGTKQFLATIADPAVSDRDKLKPFFASIYQLPAAVTAELQAALLTRLDAQQDPQRAVNGGKEVEEEDEKNEREFAPRRAIAAFRKVHLQFPGDVGCWMVFVLNVVDLMPGQGLFLAANEPHAYLSGDCVEIMAASDNVIRAGLTPKFKDVDALVESLTYKTDSLRAARFAADCTAYVPPENIPEFSLLRVAASAAAAAAGCSEEEEKEIKQLNGPAIVIVIKGKAVVELMPAGCSHDGGSEPSAAAAAAAESKTVSRGDIFAVVRPGGLKFKIARQQQGEEFLAFVGQQRNSLYTLRSSSL